MIEIEGGRAGQQPQWGDKDLGLKAGILFWRMKFGPLGWDMGLKAGIWVSSAGVGGRRRRNFKQRTDMAWCSCVAHDYNVLISMLNATCVPHCCSIFPSKKRSGRKEVFYLNTCKI